MAPAEGCALITGAARGIGAATARALSRQGWPVAVNYRNDQASADRLAHELMALGGKALPFQADVANPGAVKELFSAVVERFGPVLVLVNNAGMRADGLAPKLGEEEWAQVIDTNLSAAYRTTRIALGPMLRARFGRIVNVASVVGPRAHVGQANYAASKAGLIGFTKTVAVEVARRGVTVNAVAPGLIETKLTEGIPDGIAERIPARRSGSPDEVAACIGFLASEQAGYVTGATLAVDGGLSA